MKTIQKVQNTIAPCHGVTAAWAKDWIALPLALLALTLGSVQAATVTMTTGDGYGASSFNTAGSWDSAQAPTAGNDYHSSQYNIRTPNAAGNFTFAGDSLTIEAVGTSGGRLTFKGSGTPTITVSNLVLNGGMVHDSAASFTLAGHITLLTNGPAYNGLYTQSNATFTVASTISGSAYLNLTTETGGANTAGFILTSANTYTGGTVLNNNVFAGAETDGAFGTGNVTLGSASTLRLELGLTNNYIADNASLIVNSAANGLVLNYTGADDIGALSLNGGTTFLAEGTYGAIGSGADFTSSLISGTGLLRVVPEPSSLLMLTGGLLLLLGRYKRTSDVI